MPLAVFLSHWLPDGTFRDRSDDVTELLRCSLSRCISEARNRSSTHFLPPCSNDWILFTQVTECGLKHTYLPTMPSPPHPHQGGFPRHHSSESQDCPQMNRKYSSSRATRKFTLEQSKPTHPSSVTTSKANIPWVFIN